MSRMTLVSSNCLTHENDDSNIETMFKQQLSLLNQQIVRKNIEILIYVDSMRLSDITKRNAERIKCFIWHCGTSDCFDGL